jgi:protease-4
LVAKQRHLTVGQVNDVAQGRVWTGDQALKVKLVDKLGGLTDAIDQATMLAKLDARSHPQIEELPEQAGVFSKLMSGQISGAVAQWQPPHALEQLLWMVSEVLIQRAELGQVYCPTTPIM